MGQWVNIPPTPNWVSVSVVALMNVATSAHMTAEAEPYNAARRLGDPCRARTARMPAQAQQARTAVNQCLLAGVSWPPPGCPATTNTVRPAQVTAAATQVTGRIDWWIQNRRSRSMKTSSVASTGCTIDSRPLARARAWNTNAAARAAQPKSHSGLRNRYTTSRQPEDRRGAAVLAMCWVASLTALDRAASRAKTITISAAPRRLPVPDLHRSGT